MHAKLFPSLIQNTGRNACWHKANSSFADQLASSKHVLQKHFLTFCSHSSLCSYSAHKEKVQVCQHVWILCMDYTCCCACCTNDICYIRSNGRLSKINPNEDHQILQTAHICIQFQSPWIKILSILVMVKYERF